MLELKQEDEYKHKLFKTCLTYVFPESAEFHWVLFGRYHDSFVTGFQSYEFRKCTIIELPYNLRTHSPANVVCTPCKKFLKMNGPKSGKLKKIVKNVQTGSRAS